MPKKRRPIPEPSCLPIVVGVLLVLFLAYHILSMIG